LSGFAIKEATLPKDTETYILVYKIIQMCQYKCTLYECIEKEMACIRVAYSNLNTNIHYIPIIVGDLAIMLVEETTLLVGMAKE